MKNRMMNMAAIAIVVPLMASLAGCGKRQDSATQTKLVEQSTDLTGVWNAGGATFYVRQLGKEIWWYGELSSTNPRWTNVARGTVDDKLVNVKWVDVPRGETRGDGTLTLRIVDARHMTIEVNPNDFWVRDWERP
jgi:hypothetical protein